MKKNRKKKKKEKGKKKKNCIPFKDFYIYSTLFSAEKEEEEEKKETLMEIEKKMIDISADTSILIIIVMDQLDVPVSIANR